MSTTAAVLTALAVGVVGGVLVWLITADTEAERNARRRAERLRKLADERRCAGDRRR